MLYHAPHVALNDKLGLSGGQAERHEVWRFFFPQVIIGDVQVWPYTLVRWVLLTATPRKTNPSTQLQTAGGHVQDLLWWAREAQLA